MIRPSKTDDTPTETSPATAEEPVDVAQRDRLIEVLDTLEDRVRRQNSLKYTFLRGAVYGFGTVVGASVLVALFGGIIASTVNELTNGSVLTEDLTETPAPE